MPRIHQADYSDEAMHAALEVNIPNYASVVTTDEIIGSISSVQTLELSAPQFLRDGNQPRGDQTRGAGQ
jgi:hypothetical protein